MITPRQNEISILMLAILIMTALFVPLNSVFGYFTSGQSQFYAERDADGAYIRSYIGDEPVLYLAAGDAPYSLHVNSTCRYSYPLPIARSTDIRDLSSLQQYVDNYQCAVDYNGKYIIMEGNMNPDWFGDNLSVRQKIMTKINMEYELVHDKSWRVYERRDNMSDYCMSSLRQCVYPTKCPLSTV